MNSYHKQALSALKKLVESNAMCLSEDDMTMLRKKPDEVKQYQKRIGEIYGAIFYGFFHCAAKGIVLYQEKRVAEKFGNSIEDNYPEANEVFLKFARTYWTLKVLTYDLMEDNMEWIGAHLLEKLEQDIGPVFFPFPGPAKIAPSKREKTQREILKEVNADIDIEEFIKGNPILIRDRSASIWETNFLRILFIVKSLIGGLLLKIFPSLGPKGVVDTQIAVYKRLKKKFPTASENDLLNSLIMSRIKAPLSPTTSQEEHDHYELILQNHDKTLEDVIWAIVEYEYILSREEKLFRKLSKIDDSPTRIVEEMDKQKEEWRKYIKESIKENAEFRKLKRDYNSFLWIFSIGILFGISLVFLFPSIPNTGLLKWAISFSSSLLALVLLFYTIKISMDAFRVFEIIKPSKLQVGFLYFLLYLFLLINFFSPLVIGMYVIFLMNRYKFLTNQST